MPNREVLLLVKATSSDFFGPLQVGVACQLGSEKVMHGIRNCVDQHRRNKNSAVIQLDLKNAFYLASNLDECASVFHHLPPCAF